MVKRGLALGGLAIPVLLCGSVALAEERYTARVQSVVPSEGVLLVEEPAAQEGPVVRRVHVAGAEVVRIRRHPERPAQWVERRTEVHRLPVTTYVIVSGTRLPNGVFKASRIEVPRPSDGRVRRRSSP